MKVTPRHVQGVCEAEGNVPDVHVIAFRDDGAKARQGAVVGHLGRVVHHGRGEEEDRKKGVGPDQVSLM
jgi:hypothetical protein